MLGIFLSILKIFLLLVLTSNELVIIVKYKRKINPEYVMKNKGKDKKRINNKEKANNSSKVTAEDLKKLKELYKLVT